MAKRPSVKEILEAARRGGAASPEGAAGDAPAEPPAVEASPEAAPRVVASDVPTPEKLGRPLTVKEKLAAARANAGSAPAPAAPAAKAAKPAPPTEAAAPAEPPADVPTPEKLGRPLTVKEKLAAARANAASSAAPAGGAKPAAAKAAVTPTPVVSKRELPPLESMTDPKDLAEALRRTGAAKSAEADAIAKAKAPVKPVKEKEVRPSSVLPRPSKAGAIADSQDVGRRRMFLISTVALLWIGWGAFTGGVIAFTAMLGRFMFPNVLAEPPSTIKVGLPTNYELEEVNERFKAEWGFWIVRSSRYNGKDILYALQSVCTHLGCPPNWLGGEQKFKCPCHGSGFYISGINFEGPAPRPLERFKVTLADDGQVVVDKSQKFQEELEQWADPDSFITV